MGKEDLSVRMLSLGNKIHSKILDMGRGLDMQDFPEDLIAEFTLKIWTIKAK